MNDLLDKIAGASLYDAVTYFLVLVLLALIFTGFIYSVKWFIKALNEDSVVPDETSSKGRYSVLENLSGAETEGIKNHWKVTSKDCINRRAMSKNTNGETEYYCDADVAFGKDYSILFDPTFIQDDTITFIH
jgi:hypothetical protein